jgi:para-aminobenzoate synthetase component 1
LRTTSTKHIANPTLFKEQILYWSQQFNETIILDSNVESNENQLYKSYDLIIAVDAFTSIQTDYEKAFEDLYQYQSKANDWLFGYLAYDLKNDVEHLQSQNFDGLGFSDLYFFQPKKIFLLKDSTLEIQYLNMCDDEIDSDLEDILNQEKSESQESKVTIQQRISKENYIKKVEKTLAHIRRGDIYEANFCMEFYSNEASIAPFEVFTKLNKISAAPFSVYLKKNNHYLLSASPERYLKKENEKVISQPIKGTAKRNSNSELDGQNKVALQYNAKERSENIMIVDLVRNDLSQTATKSSVEVEELCNVYSFKQVHQMISTITSNVAHTTSPIEILRTTFPMGSMTGAPKISAMKIIEDLEETKRGLYSGAVGYFTPSGNFDFNVVIRSILYNSDNKYLSFSVGSAITSEAIPENEYEECLLKAKAMFEVLNEKG